MDTEIQTLVDSFIGASVLVISQDDRKYKGFIREINIQDSTIHLKKVICYGTHENRTSIIARGEALFTGSGIKDLQVLKPTLSNEPCETSNSLGQFVSVMTKEDVRVEGVLAYLDEERLVMENAYCYGTEGRERRRRLEIAACKKLVHPVVFRFKDLKDHELIFMLQTQREDDQSVFPSLARAHAQH